MRVGSRRCSILALAGLIGLGLAASARADVNVTIVGDTAYATISLTGDNGSTYDADVTIVFDTPQHLTPRSLNLTAEIIDPATVNPTLPPGNTIDPAFPVMITVEPPNLPYLYTSSFERGEGVSGALSFINTYQIDVHTHDLTYVDNSPYRLAKAPVDGSNPFVDVTTDVMAGSVRVRGRGGAFSNFVVTHETNAGLVVAAAKIVELNVRILAAAISDGLRLDLLTLLAKVDALLLIDLTGALDALDQLIGLIDLNAGTNIANVWTAHHDLVNDAGEMEQIADTLQFSMEHPGTPSP